jgi:hypothetical protein
VPAQFCTLVAVLRKILYGLLITVAFTSQAQDEIFAGHGKKLLDSLNNLTDTQWLLDSLAIQTWADSLRSGIEAKKSDVNGLKKKIDSLNNLQLPTGKYTRKLDSLAQRKDQLLMEVKGKQEELLSKTKSKLTEWKTNIQTKLGVDVNGLKLPQGQIPDGTLPDLKLPSTDLKIPSLSASDFEAVGLSKELSQLQQSLQLDKPEWLGEWQGKIGDIKGNVPSLQSLSNPDKLIETAATNIDGVNAVKKQLDAGGFEQSEMGAIVKNAQDPEAMKQVAIEQVKEEVKREAFNHFAGKEQVLQAAMDQISKYKQKYSSISSLSEIKKVPPNPMKGKPFIERVVPGIAIQIHTKNYLNFDFNPYAAYRLSGRLSVGLGWNQRLAMDWSNKSVVGKGRVYGPRIFGEFKLPKGFAIRQEFEEMNTPVPTYLIGTSEGTRQWVFTSMTGLKKEYMFFKKIKGFTIVQFDFISMIKPSHKSPYGDVVNTRFGFEFPMKKKRPKEKGNF